MRGQALCERIIATRSLGPNLRLDAQFSRGLVVVGAWGSQCPASFVHRHPRLARRACVRVALTSTNPRAVHNGSGSLERARKRVVLSKGVFHAESGGRMSFILAIMAVPFLTATGIYDPPVMQHGHCIARPGSFDALYCSAPASPPQRQTIRRARR